jgi:hypothetical protein
MLKLSSSRNLEMRANLPQEIPHLSRYLLQEMWSFPTGDVSSPLEMRTHRTRISKLRDMSHCCTHGLFEWGTCRSAPTMGLLSTPEVKILERKEAVDLSLNERGGYAKFGCTGSRYAPVPVGLGLQS